MGQKIKIPVARLSLAKVLLASLNLAGNMNPVVMALSWERGIIGGRSWRITILEQMKLYKVNHLSPITTL